MNRNWMLFAPWMALACGSRGEVTESTTQPILGGAKESGRTSAILVLRSDATLDNIEEACSGVLIAPRLVLTAAHCVGQLKHTAGASVCDATSKGPADSISAAYAAKRLLVYSDEVALTSTSFVATHAYEVTKIRLSPNTVGKPLCGNDVALIELSAAVAEAQPSGIRKDPVTVGEKVTAVGYGKDGNKDEGGSRRSRSGVAVTSVGASKNPDDSTKSTDTEWLADEGPCGGDSGSPAFDAKGDVVGILSRGNPTTCVDMVYTSVSKATGFGDWIRETVVAASEENGDPPPAWALEADPDAGPPTQTAAGTKSDSGCGVAQRGSNRSTGLLGIALLALLLVRCRPRSKR